MSATAHLGNCLHISEVKNQRRKAEYLYTTIQAVAVLPMKILRMGLFSYMLGLFQKTLSLKIKKMR